MEETQNQTEVNEVNQVTPPQPTSYTVEPQSKGGKSKWLLIFIGLLILGGAGIFFFTRSSNKEEATPTPSFEVTNEETSTPLPTNTPAPVKKSEISIEIQNGTGITGEAAYLQEKLKVLGYSDIKVGNASSTDNTETTVTFLKTTPQTVQDEIKKELEKIYKTVNVKTSSTQTVDILIVTGLRGTQTSKPSTTATPKASGTASPKPSATASPSSSPTTNP
ncbi:hypothetical protein A2422_02825 [Candidatus Woesebacteria bacterium RIFOXYC1_FULL_31_51]|uniref:Cell envelope-like protein function transcriptional attenuator common domain protein n=1 Tax=Candidatus Woesebacteria bacterium GW2011_GWC2_31_9 TaxID=1618586 RepID=A0A0G0BIQ7_9BACT|nr:MAG: hypothetical protein UR17_C0001G0070 [Candidatus Woesebacteria bacterium GW2011_GWF1_31_35]KKP23433.1 MAG: Cell envelope-like protein function transcriptional attenuator common domain protein [Candidatus Woesebacteria bacterium GW2011_GWC1_30_29]KKP26410.1 MAG: Cell envelope-like protein function transcriptional attenuator common domain protein [Candidatus Woesebacteria bacterium GW2011_GWD1_31_12]KKP27709.1 MAG: Cell envelope-like protein function transcriptional attenuator common domai